jgi:hypothetical protein
MIGQRSQRHRNRAVAVVAQELGGDFERQAGLAGSRRVLPAPGGPVRVRKRTSGGFSKALTSARSRSRPTKVVDGVRSSGGARNCGSAGTGRRRAAAAKL